MPCHYCIKEKKSFKKQFVEYLYLAPIVSKYPLSQNFLQTYIVSKMIRDIEQTWTSEKGTTTIPKRISAKARDAEKSQEQVILLQSQAQKDLV